MVWCAVFRTVSNHVGAPQFRLGLISDIQFADVPDGHSFGGNARYYRAGLPSLKRAVQGWMRQGVDCAIHLGDLMDGKQPPEGRCQSLDALIDEFNQLERPHYHLIGNHDLYNFSREVLNARLQIGGPGLLGYYQFSPHPAWRVVVLDGYDVSLLGWPQDHPLHKEAERILAERNPNEEKNSPAGLVGIARRFVKYGGGVGAAQLDWLRGVLAEAATAGQKAIVCCHEPLMPGTSVPACLLYNFEEVLGVLRGAGNVAATFSGHAHKVRPCADLAGTVLMGAGLGKMLEAALRMLQCWKDGYLQDSSGIHHRVLNAVVETPAGQDCYGWLDVFPDRLHLTGCGSLESATYMVQSNTLELTKA